jgi:hypothetical protein
LSSASSIASTRRPARSGPRHAHRLNRTEYANTVRDLLGVDFRAADGFCRRLGYGFDNIGDVSVSPTLMQEEPARQGGRKQSKQVQVGRSRR